MHGVEVGGPVRVISPFLSSFLRPNPGHRFYAGTPIYEPEIAFRRQFPGLAGGRFRQWEAQYGNLVISGSFVNGWR